METVYMLLFLLAAVCFLLDFLNVRAPKVHLVGLGLLFWVLVPLIQTLKSL